MKKYCISVLAVAWMSLSVATAQNKTGQAPPPKPDAAQMAQQRTNDMVKRYGLSKAQAAKLLVLNKEYGDKMGPMGGPGGPGGMPPKDGMQPPKDGQRPPQPPKDGKGNGQRPPKPNAQMEKQMQADRAAYNKRLSAIMTAEQYKKYQTDEARRPQRPPQNNNIKK